MENLNNIDNLKNILNIFGKKEKKSVAMQLLEKHGYHPDEKCLWNNVNRERLYEMLPNELVDLIEKTRELCSEEDDPNAFAEKLKEFTPEQKQELIDIGYLAPEAATASNNCDSDIFKDALEKVIAKIGDSKISPKEIDKLAQESLSVDDCKIFEKSSFYEEEFPSVVRSADYPEFAKDESGQARKKDDIIELAKKKYGKAVVYHYSNLLRMIGSTIRMQQATHVQPATN